MKRVRDITKDEIIQEYLSKKAPKRTCSAHLIPEAAAASAINPQGDKPDYQQQQQQQQQQNLLPVKKTTATTTTGLLGGGTLEPGHTLLDDGAMINLDSQLVSNYWWHDKYRPRKPRHFIRVHTGYEWNKYNRVHYDRDNPPPSTVQGYKFDIYYPDLMNKSSTPSYTFERDGDATETCIIRFHAGAPYEDVAFRIVRNELERSPKMGFKSTFENGVLHLYFNFKRYRYRR